MQASPEWVALSPRFTPGWPWPEDSYGLTPMYGEDGWCRTCGTPSVEQRGVLVIQGSSFPSSDVWMPNWQFDVVCVSTSVADQLRRRFSVELREVLKPRTGPSGAYQLIPVETREPWYREEDLQRAVRLSHPDEPSGRAGAACERCGRWRWLPVNEGDAPVVLGTVRTASDLIASPERFGDGLESFRHLLFRRPLAELLIAASPDNWTMVEIDVER